KAKVPARESAKPAKRKRSRNLARATAVAAPPIQPAAPSQETNARPKGPPTSPPALPVEDAAPIKEDPPVPRDQEPWFPVVGIGSSAGGLEALEQFLSNVQRHSGMAFVIIQHLDPTHKGAMVELLKRASSIPVVQVEDGQRVEPDNVYVIPPN